MTKEESLHQADGKEVMGARCLHGLPELEGLSGLEELHDPYVYTGQVEG